MLRVAEVRRAGGAAPAGQGVAPAGGGGDERWRVAAELVIPPSGPAARASRQHGRITALDLNSKEMVWQIAHGDTPDNIRESPGFERSETIPRTGRQGRIGVLTTKTLLRRGRRRDDVDDGRRAPRRVLRARHDKATGKDIGQVCTCRLLKPDHPMTYMLNGRRYIAVSISARRDTARSCSCFGREA